MSKPLTDSCIMPEGKYKGRTMEEVPAHYLIYVYEQDLCSDQVKEYIADNMDALELELKNL